MDKKYIGNDEVIVSALDQIKDSKNVNAFTIMKTDNKYCYCALLTDGTTVQLTKGKKFLDLLFNPMKYLEQFLGCFYAQDFIMCEQNTTLINKNNIHSVVVCEGDEQSKNDNRFNYVYNCGYISSSYSYKHKSQMLKEYNRIKDIITNLDMCLDK